MNSTYLLREFRRNFPPLFPLLMDFKYYLIKAHGTKLHVKFLKDCMSEHVVPVSLLPGRLVG